MKRILLIDYTSHHPEVVAALLRNFSGHQVRVVATASFLHKYGEQFNLSDKVILIKDKRISLSEWLRVITPVVRQQDVIIFSTTVRNRLLLATLRIDTSAKKVAIIHNSHYFLQKFPIGLKTYHRLINPMSSRLQSFIRFLPEKFKFFRRKIRHIFNRTTFKEFNSSIDYFCFGNEHLAAQFSFLTNNRNTVVLPFSRSRCDDERPLYGDVLRAAIIGSVSPQRRDYEWVIRALDNTILRNDFELYIFGACYDKRYADHLKRLIENISNPNLHIFFDQKKGFISVSELKEKLRDIHLLINPIQSDFSFHLHNEIYGLTKISGAEADCLEYNRPILLPSIYRFGADVESFVLPYSDEQHFGKIIAELQDASNLLALYAKSEQGENVAGSDDVAEKFFRKIGMR